MANFVPAAAVRRRWQALIGITGRKARVGGRSKLEVESRGPTTELPPKLPGSRTTGESGTPGGAVKCVDIRRNAGGESDSLGRS